MRAIKIFQTISNYIDFFIERLIRDKKIDVPVLVICFGISCLVCFVYKMQGVEDNTFVSELTIKNEQAGFIQAGSPSTESIKIMLSGADAKSFKPTDFKPYIDLSYVSSAGKQKLPVLLQVSDDAKNAVSLQTKCEPSHVTIDVDEVVDSSIRESDTAVPSCSRRTFENQGETHDTNEADKNNECEDELQKRECRV